MSGGLRRLLVALVVLGGLLGLAPQASSASPTAASPVDDAVTRIVLVGAPGLSWSDVDRSDTPSLWSLAVDGQVASMTVRAVRSRACGVDGWLTLSSGRRAADLAGACREASPPGPDGVVPQWADYLEAARVDGYGGRPGTLADSLAARGTCVVAVGPDAGVGAARTDGRVERYSDTVPASLTCPLTLVDAGVLPVDAAARAEALRRLDDLVGRLRPTLPPTTRLVVAGLGDGVSPVRPRALLVSGPTPGILTSGSTRQPGLVQLQDLTATLVERFGEPVVGLTGRPLEVDPDDGPAAERVADRVGFEVRSATLREVSPQVTGWLAGAFAVWCAVVGLLLHRRGAAAGLPAALRLGGLGLAVVPLATFVVNLVPWWRAERPGLAFVGVLVPTVAVVVGAAAVAGRRRRHGALAVVAVLTLVVLVADVATGSRLQLASVFGQNPTVGGRFYGIGNTSYALYGAAAMSLVGLVATSRLPRAVSAAAVVLLVVTAVEGYPSLGADFGGPPGLLLGGLVVLAGAAAVRLSASRVLLAGAVVVLVTAAVSVLDWLRPPASRTHLGEFVETVLDGGVDDVIGRKVAQNLTNLTSPPLLAIAVGALVLGLLVWRAGVPLDRTEVLVVRGTAVLAAVGFAVNDSGLVVPAFAALVLLPLLAVRREEGQQEAVDPAG